MKDPLDILENAYRQFKPSPEWERQVAKRLQPRRKVLAFAGPALAGLVAYAFLLVASGSPETAPLVPQQVFERQMAQFEPEPTPPEVSVLGRRAA